MTHDELRLTIANDLGKLADVTETAHSFLEKRGIGERVRYATRLALEEVLSNVIRHGYQDTAEHEIRVCLRVTRGNVELEFVDDGCEFDPLSVPAVDIRVPLRQRRSGGLGIHCCGTRISEIRYERAGGRNHLQVRI